MFSYKIKNRKILLVTFDELLLICTAMYRKAYTVSNSNRCIAMKAHRSVVFLINMKACIKDSTLDQCHVSTVNYNLSSASIGALHCQLSMFSSGRLFALSTIR
jgi:hypothetical protein